MKLDINQVEEIAALARLKLNSKEKKMYSEQLSAVLDYIETLNEVDTNNIPETCNVAGLENITRDDEIEPADNEKIIRLINCFPDKRINLLKVKAVFSGDE